MRVFVRKYLYQYNIPLRIDNLYEHISFEYSIKKDAPRNTSYFDQQESIREKG